MYLGEKIKYLYTFERRQVYLMFLKIKILFDFNSKVLWNLPHDGLKTT